MAVVTAPVEVRQSQMPEALNVPAEILPDDCQLVPSPSRVLQNGSTASGLWGDIGIPRNPWAGSDRLLIARIYSRMFGPPLSPDGPPLTAAQANQFALKSTEHIEAGYAAFYARKDALMVTHAYGVRFRSQSDLSTALRNRKGNYVFVVGEIVVKVSSDDGCSHAVIQYLSSLSKK
jgi:hypothetical protein